MAWICGICWITAMFPITPAGFLRFIRLVIISYKYVISTHSSMGPRLLQVDSKDTDHIARTAKTLIILHGRAHWCEFSLGAHVRRHILFTLGTFFCFDTSNNILQRSSLSRERNFIVSHFYTLRGFLNSYKSSAFSFRFPWINGYLNNSLSTEQFGEFFHLWICTILLSNKRFADTAWYTTIAGKTFSTFPNILSKSTIFTPIKGHNSVEK